MKRFLGNHGANVLVRKIRGTSIADAISPHRCGDIAAASFLLTSYRHGSSKKTMGNNGVDAEEEKETSKVSPESPSHKEHTQEPSDDAKDASRSPPESVKASDENNASPSSSTHLQDTKGTDQSVISELNPVRWDMPDPDEDFHNVQIVDEKGEYIVSKVQWPTGEVAYTTPAPVDDKLAPRFGYNVVQVKKHVSWWQYNQKYPRISIAYINIQVLFILGLAWLMAFLTDEYRRTTEMMRTPGAMVGEHRGRGPVTEKTQKVTFTTSEMNSLVNRAQDNWMDANAEANYIGSKDYKMQKIPRPKEFSAEDFRKR